MPARNTTRVMRAILACMQPLLGTRSTGTATVRAVGADTLLEKNTFGIPIIVSASGAKQLDWGRMVRVDADTTVTAAGTPVALTSVLGGPSANIDAGTQIRWDPPLEDVELVSTLAAPMTGGVAAVGPGTLGRVTVYEGIGASRVPLDLFLAKTGRFPAAVLSWDSSDPADKNHRSHYMVRDRWTVVVVTSRADASEGRASEALNILDALEQELGMASAIDDYVFSSPQVELGGRRRIATTETSYVYAMSFATWGAVMRTDRRVFYDWLRTRLDAPVDDDTDLPLVVDKEFVMNPAFSSAFSKAFARVFR